MTMFEVFEKAAMILATVNKDEHWFYEQFGDELREFKPLDSFTPEMKEVLIKEKFIEWDVEQGYWNWTGAGNMGICWMILTQLVEDQDCVELTKS